MTVLSDDNFLNDENLKEMVIAALKKIYDPEIPTNIYDLGLIYDIRILEGKIEVDMTLTSPNCPVAETFPQTVIDSLLKIPNVRQVKVDLVWEPPWSPDLLSEATRLELGLL